MLNRRTFLRAAGGWLGATGLPRGRAAPAVEPLSLGIGLYGMKSTPLAEGIRRCAAIGYRNIEFTLYPGYASEPAAFSAADRRRVASLLRELEIAASCLKARPDTGAAPEARRRGEDQVKDAARLALDLALPAPPLITVHVGGKTTDWETQRAFILEQVGRWQQASAALGVRLALKPHVGNTVDRPERLLWLLERIPGLAAVYDYSHFQLIDVPLEESLRHLQAHLAMIQVKDARHAAGGKHEFLLPGDGGTDYERYFRALDRIGFAGPVVVEVSAQLFNRPGYDAVQAAQRSFDVLSAALARRRAH